MFIRLHFAIGVGCVLMCQSASAQITPAAQIKKTSTAPVIDGNGTDAVWASANVYGTSTWFVVEGTGAPGPITSTPDFSVEWKALWDDTNLYITTKVHDDAIVNSLPSTGGPDTNADFNDDGIEFYIDAQNIKLLTPEDPTDTEYQPEATGLPYRPGFQFTSIAGWTPAIADDATYVNPDTLTPVSPRSLRVPATLPNTSFTHGINSYANSQDTLLYPQTQGSATSGPVTGSEAAGFDWEFEVSFPWAALQETTANILARDGIFGLGVAYNDDDDRDTRDNQYMWATDRNDLWHLTDGFPNVQLVQASTKPGDLDLDGDVDGNDVLKWQQGTPTNPVLTDIKGNFGTAVPVAGGVPEPAGIALLGLALTVLGSCARRRSSAICKRAS